MDSMGKSPFKKRLGVRPFAVRRLQVISGLGMQFFLNDRSNNQSVIAISLFAVLAQVAILAVVIIEIVYRRRESLARGMDIFGAESPVVAQIFTTDGIAVLGE